MQKRKDIFDAVTESFCSDGYYFESIRFEIPDGFLKTIKRDFDLIAFNSKKIIFFTRLPDEGGAEMVVPAIRAALNCLVNKFSVSLNSVIACGSNARAFFYLNKYNDKLSVFDDTDEGADLFLELLESEIHYGPEIFNYEQMKKMADSLILFSGTKEFSQKQMKIKTAADGTAYVRKHGTWWEASEVNTDELYTIAALAGMLGGHLFYQKQYGKGVLYLLTLGLFGFGWFFDCLEIFIGVYRDPTRRYLLPLSNKTLGLVLFLCGCVVFCLEFLLLSFIFNFLLGSFTESLIHML